MLAAALKKGGGAAPPTQEQKIDSAAFPCVGIPEGAPLDAGADLAADVETRLRLHRQGSLAGSVPRHYVGSVSPMRSGLLASRRRCSPTAAVALAAAAASWCAGRSGS